MSSVHQEAADDQPRPATDHCYAAYVSGDRSVLERHLSDDLTFSAPPDVGIDRVTNSPLWLVLGLAVLGVSIGLAIRARRIRERR